MTGGTGFPKDEDTQEMDSAEGHRALRACSLQPDCALRSGASKVAQ